MATKFYVSYRDVKLHEDIILGPLTSDIDVIKFFEIIYKDIPKSAIGIRVSVNAKDINFGTEDFINIHVSNKKFPKE